MDTITTEIAAKCGAELIQDIFKSAFAGIKKADEWLKEETRVIFAAEKYKESIEERYNSVHIFGMNKPVPLRNIYVKVNLLDKPVSYTNVDIKTLEKNFDCDRRRFGIIRKTISGINVVNENKHIVILGKPGAGKSTFFKHLLLKSIDGELERNFLPVFISLKDWSDTKETLEDYIIRQFDICNFPSASEFTRRILKKGRCMLLLDAFDEVTSNINDAIRQIKEFCIKYNKNQILISCRVAAYNYVFENFIIVEVADFDDDQIKSFVENWFAEDKKKANLCFNKLFDNPPIKELASVPLLLTLLCISFDETMDFPKSRAELYKEAIDALLKKWDSSRSITRSEIYKGITLRKKEIILCLIAKETFERGEYFIPQSVLSRIVAKYIRNLPNVNESELDIDSETIIKSIESQHGLIIERARNIYSFSHLTLQEYFAAKYLNENYSGDTLEFIGEKVGDKRWNEVILLLSEMLPNANELLLLIRRKITSFVNKDLLSYINKIECFSLDGFQYDNVLKNYILFSTNSIGSLDRGCEFVVEYVKSMKLEINYLPVLSKTSFQFYNFVNSSASFTFSNNIYNSLDKILSRLEKQNGVTLNKTDLIQVKDVPTIKGNANAIDKYITGSLLLLRCINSDIYIDKEVRAQILSSLLKESSVSL